VRSRSSSRSEQRDARRKASVASLRGFETPSREAIERRRAQLWYRTAGILVAAVAAVGLLAAWPQEQRVVLTADTLRAVFLAAAGCFAAAAGLQERELTRLTRDLTDERVVTAALTTRLNEVEVLLAAGREMNAVLELPRLLETILRISTELLDAGGGSLMVVEDGELVAVQVRGRPEALGTRVRLGDGIAGHVALRREPILIDGQVDPDVFPGLTDREPYVESAMSVPLVHDDELLGVLNVNAPAGHGFTQHDLRALAVFAEQAAGAIANARRYEAERDQVAELRHLREVGT
jgi:putative methionine-R-sulfoxide reductase with GAF domain